MAGMETLGLGCRSLLVGFDVCTFWDYLKLRWAFWIEQGMKRLDASFKLVPTANVSRRVTPLECSCCWYIPSQVRAFQASRVQTDVERCALFLGTNSKRGGAAEYNCVPESECFILPGALPDFLTFFNAGYVKSASTHSLSINRTVNRYQHFLIPPYYSLTALCGLVLPGGGKMRIAPNSPMAKYFPENIDSSTPYKPELVVVTAAAGGVGLMACQFALAAGNQVVGLAGSDDKLAALKLLGVQHALNYKSFATPKEMAAQIKQVAGRDADLIWETVGGETLVALSEIAGDKGRLVVIGQISGGYGDDETAKKRQEDLGKPAQPLGAQVLTAANPARDAAIANLKARNANMGAYFMSITGKDCHDTFGRFVDAEVGLWESKDLKGVTDDTQKFVGVDKYVDGVEYLHKGKNIGKIVIKVS